MSSRETRKDREAPAPSDAAAALGQALADLCRSPHATIAEPIQPGIPIALRLGGTLEPFMVVGRTRRGEYLAIHSKSGPHDTARLLTAAQIAAENPAFTPPGARRDHRDSVLSGLTASSIGSPSPQPQGPWSKDVVTRVTAKLLDSHPNVFALAAATNAVTDAKAAISEVAPQGPVADELYVIVEKAFDRARVDQVKGRSGLFQRAAKDLVLAYGKPKNEVDAAVRKYPGLSDVMQRIGHLRMAIHVFAAFAATEMKGIFRPIQWLARSLAWIEAKTAPGIEISDRQKD